MVSDLESQVTMLAIIVTLLARLRGFDIFTDDFTHFFSFCDQVVSKKLAFTSLGPIERSTTLSAVKNFEIGDHVYLRVSPIKGTRRFGIKGKLPLDT